MRSVVILLVVVFLVFAADAKKGGRRPGPPKGRSKGGGSQGGTMGMSSIDFDLGGTLDTSGSGASGSGSSGSGDVSITSHNDHVSPSKSTKGKKPSGRPNKGSGSHSHNIGVGPARPNSSDTKKSGRGSGSKPGHGGATKASGSGSRSRPRKGVSPATVSVRPGPKRSHVHTPTTKAPAVTTSTGGCCGVNYCGVDNGGCADVCVNTYLGAYCLCNPGYQLVADTETCNFDLASVGVDSNGDAIFMCNDPEGRWPVNGTQCENVNECEVHNDCHHECEDNVGSYKCSCFPGYELSVNNMECIDTNECALDTDGCSTGSTCINTPGSFQCLKLTFNVVGKRSVSSQESEFERADEMMSELEYERETIHKQGETISDLSSGQTSLIGWLAVVTFVTFIALVMSFYTIRVYKTRLEEALMLLESKEYMYCTVTGQAKK